MFILFNFFLSQVGFFSVILNIHRFSQWYYLKRPILLNLIWYILSKNEFHTLMGFKTFILIVFCLTVWIPWAWVLPVMVIIFLFYLLYFFASVHRVRIWPQNTYVCACVFSCWPFSLVGQRNSSTINRLTGPSRPRHLLGLPTWSFFLCHTKTNDSFYV